MTKVGNPVTQMPLVDYLVLGGDPHLVADECTSCGARFFDRRNACGGCSGRAFSKVRISPTGTLRSFTIVSGDAPNVSVPFIAGIVDCHGTTVRGLILGVDPDPKRLSFGMELRLTTMSVGTDSAGNEAIGFGFVADYEGGTQ